MKYECTPALNVSYVLDAIVLRKTNLIRSSLSPFLSRVMPLVLLPKERIQEFAVSP